MLGLDVLNDPAVASADNEWHAELAGQVCVEVAGRDYVGVRDDAKNILRARETIHFRASKSHAPDGSGSRDQGPTRPDEQLRVCARGLLADELKVREVGLQDVGA